MHWQPAGLLGTSQVVNHFATARGAPLVPCCCCCAHSRHLPVAQRPLQHFDGDTHMRPHVPQLLLSLDSFTHSRAQHVCVLSQRFWHGSWQVGSPLGGVMQLCPAGHGTCRQFACAWSALGKQTY